MKLRTVTNLIIILSVIGVIVAGISTYEHYALLGGAEEGSFCDFGDFVSCSSVNTSPYSEVVGIPTAFMGVLWFIAAIVLAYQVKGRSKSGFWKNSAFYLFVWSIIGLLTVVWLVYAEIVLVGAICLLCTIVHIIVIIILVLSYKTLQRPIGKYLGDIFYK